MYHSSTASSTAMPTPVRSSTSQSKHSSCRDERPTTGPLTAERAMMEKIRSKLENAQLRLAHSQAKSVSRHGYNGNSAAPMSLDGTRIMPTSSTHLHHRHYHSQSASRHTHTHTQSRSQQATSSHSRHQRQSPTLQDGDSYYFPPDYKSARAPVVKSVYLEDLSMTINAEQRTPPVSTLEKNDGRRVAASNTPTYYAPLDESRVSSLHHHRHERSQTTSLHVRSERHAVHEQQQQQLHHHRSEKTETSSRHYSRNHSHHRNHRRYEHTDAEPVIPAPPKTTRGVRSHPRERPYEEDDDGAPSQSAFVSSAFAMHVAVPLSAINVPSSLRHSKQPLAANGQPSRSALKHRVEYPYVDSDVEERAEREAATPSSRVRFHEGLTTAAYSPVAKNTVAACTYEHSKHAVDKGKPKDPRHVSVSKPAKLVEAERSDSESDGEHRNTLEPVVGLKHSRVVAEQQQKPTNEHTARSSMATPSSPRDASSQSRTTNDNEKENREPRRRRGSSAAARTPPHHSPSSSCNNYIRKSLSTVEPPKSAINLHALDQFDLRPRRASREKRFSETSGDVDIDEMASEGTRRSSLTETDAFADSVAQLASSPIRMSFGSGFDSFGAFDSPRVSQGSLHCSELMFEDDGSLPFGDSYTPYGHDSLGLETILEPKSDARKVSSSSSDKYSDALSFADDGEEIGDAPEIATTVTKVPDFVVPHRTSGGSTLSYSDDEATPRIVQVPSQSEYNAFWQENDDDDDTLAPVVSEPFAARESQASPDQTEEAVGIPLSTASATAVPAPPPTRYQRHDSGRLPQSHSPRKPMPFSQSLMMLSPTTATQASSRPPPMSTHIRPSPATAHARVSRPTANFSVSTTGVPRAPVTVDGSSPYVPRHLRPKNQLTQLRKAMPPSISALSGLANGPVTFELNVALFYEVEWHTGEFGFSFQRVYVEDAQDDGARRMFLRMLLNTERSTCASFKQVRVGDVLIEIGHTRVCDLQLDSHGGGAALTKFFTDLRTKTPLRLVFQRMDPMSWDGGVEL